MVDRNLRNVQLVQQLLEKEGYPTEGATSVDEMEREVKDRGDIALALIDLAGLPREVWNACEDLRRRGIPFLVISPRQAAAIQQASIAHGARGVLVKPLAMRELLAVVKRLLEEEEG